MYSLISDIVDKDAAVSSSVKCSSQASEFLLTSGIPDLTNLTYTSRLMTLPSTTTYFSMKSAPTVAL
jgi:hypothetical protein